MKYLTRITVGKSQAADLQLSDAYAWHRKLWEAFPGQDGQNRDFLFRIDDTGRDFCVLLLAKEQPDTPAWGCWEQKRISDSFLDHAVYRFQLRANPTMRRSRDRRRLGIYQEDRLHEWIERKAEQHGFEIQARTLAVGAPVDVFFRKKGRRGKHVAVDYTGVLKVTRREDFVEAFTTGIGSAKAFGFGMLMLAPLE